MSCVNMNILQCTVHLTLHSFRIKLCSATIDLKEAVRGKGGSMIYGFLKLII